MVVQAVQHAGIQTRATCQQCFDFHQQAADDDAGTACHCDGRQDKHAIGYENQFTTVGLNVRIERAAF